MLKILIFHIDIKRIAKIKQNGVEIVAGTTIDKKNYHYLKSQNQKLLLTFEISDYLFSDSFFFIFKNYLKSPKLNLNNKIL